MYTSPRTISRGGNSPRRRCGRLRTVRRFSVTSSPVTPSPRVAPRTKTPFSYSRDMERPSILGSTQYSRPSGRAASMRSSKAVSSSKENTSVRLSSGTSWRTGSKLLLAVPPTCWEGEAGS